MNGKMKNGGRTMISLSVKSIYTFVNGNREVHALLDNLLAVRAGNYKYTNAYKLGKWDGYVRFYDILRNRFLTGFLPRVVSHLEKCGMNVEIKNKELVFDGYRDDITQIKLNGVDEARWKTTQMNVLEKMLRTKRCAVKMGTGAGKTEIIAGVLKALSDRRGLVLVHRIELLEQTIQRLKLRLGEDIGRISSDDVNLNERITVGMVQSVWSKRPQLANWLKNDVDVLVIDECHHAAAKTWAYVAMNCGAEWRYGLSGTPITYSSDRDMYLIGLTGDVVRGVGVSELVEEGYAVQPVVNIVAVPIAVGGSWKRVFEWVYGENDEMLLVLKDIIRKEVGAGKKGIIVFIERIEHGKRIMEELKKEGYKVEFAHGGRTDEERLEIISGMRKKTYDVIVASTIFDEGIDVAGIGAVVFWCSTKSITRIMQRIGRGVRVDTDKRMLNVWDFVVSNRYIKNHAKKRLEYYRLEGIECSFWMWNGKEVLKTSE